jgi:hypothetical protein
VGNVENFALWRVIYHIEVICNHSQDRSASRDWTVEPSSSRTLLPLLTLLDFACRTVAAASVAHRCVGDRRRAVATPVSPVCHPGEAGAVAHSGPCRWTCVSRRAAR